MQVTLVVRLLDADGALLAWAPVRAEARGDQCLWACEPLVAAPTAAGVATSLVVHWPDLHVVARRPLWLSVAVGQVVSLTFAEPLMRFPTAAGPLPGVTVGSTVTRPGVGAMGA